MKYLTRIRLIKFLLNTQGVLSLLAMFIYMIPIAISFETKTCDMIIVAKLFVIATVVYFIYLFSLNKYLSKYNNIMDLDGYKNYIKEMIDLLTTLGKGNTMIEISILFFSAVLITYAVWWWKADIHVIEAIIEYFILVVACTTNVTMIIKYIKNFNIFYKRLYAEVYK